MTIYNLNNFPETDKIFVFDTNILIYLHSDYNENNKPFNAYTEISNFLIKNKCRVYLDVLVFNEFVNRLICKKLDHKFNKKIDRNTEKYNNCLNNIKIIIQNLKNTYNIEWSSNKLNLFDSLDNINYVAEFNKFEFSDWSIKEITKTIGGILITHDGDFINSAKNGEINIFTINKKIKSWIS